MIVSVSRRCDIPAFGSDCFMEQLRRGAVEVANPFHPSQKKRVSLKKKNVDAFVFWSRDPRPLMAHLPEIERGGHPYYFLLSATGYPRLLEPSVPSLAEVVAFFSALAAAIGRRRVIWRYDPVIFTAETTFDFHVHAFSRLANLLAPFTSRVIVSFFDPYPKVLRRLRKAGIEPGEAAGSPAQQSELLSRFAASAARNGIEIQSCAEAALAAGVRPGKCVDDELLNELFGLHIPYRKDPSQRKLCLCQQSVDIGSYGTCRHGCLYCYAC
ncbi:MAG: DUF1848 domain-containing protein [Candidatus Aminicenantes bacterium]|nr:DUF1848 domain-containing protein [Candidatus Aminicenantes bacterium]